MKRLTLKTWSRWRNIAATLATWGKLRRQIKDKCGGRPIGATWRKLILSMVRMRHGVLGTELKGSSFCQYWNPQNIAESHVVAGVERVDIGLPYYRPHRTNEVRERKQVMKANKKNVELERALRLRTCKLHMHSTCQQHFIASEEFGSSLWFLFVPQSKSLWIECRSPGKRAAAHSK